MINDLQVATAWSEVGYSVRPLGRKIFCQTLPKRTQPENGILMPDSAMSFYSGPAHLQIIQARVLSVGPQVSVIKKGDIISFQRLYFGRIWDLQDGTKGGWIDMAQVIGCSKESIGNQ